MITHDYKIIDSHTYTMWDDAFEYLESRLHMTINDDMRQEFRGHKNTATNPRMELIEDCDCAYSAQVLYDINVLEG